jgi:small conductance mechanosensitive channel
MLEAAGQALTAGLLRAGLTLLLLVVATGLALKVVNVVSAEIDKRLIATTEDYDRRARLRTLRKVAKNTARVLILSIAALIALGTLGVDIGPLLAAAGIFGLAISLGAQTLIKDVIGGLTILIEDEYRVGDTVRIDDVSGEVERITLRRTDVRDAEGRLFVIPNGEVRIVGNETRDWSRALVELNLGYDADVPKAIAALDESLIRLSADPAMKPYLLAEPEIFGWNEFSDWAVVVRLRAKVTAGKQGEVARVMRQYAFEALQAAGVPIASHSRIVWQPGPALSAGAAQA